MRSLEVVIRLIFKFYSWLRFQLRVAGMNFEIIWLKLQLPSQSVSNKIDELTIKKKSAKVAHSVAQRLRSIKG
jgi:hypothetical protein